MPILLPEILRHSTVEPARPLLRAGFKAADLAQVRWVHSSEVLDISPLLRGGELLLTGGLNLAAASVQQQIAYIESLAERRIAALAIETGSHLSSLPPEVILTAQKAELPLVELRNVVPFIGITEAINSMLVSQSVAQLQRADVVSHTMAAELGRGGGLDELLRVLARMIPADVSLTDVAGSRLGAAQADGVEREVGQRVEIELPVRGAVIGTLRIDVPAVGDAVMARIAGERAIDILALALLQRRSPTLKEVARTELVRAVVTGGNSWRLPQLCSAAGMDATAPMVALIARSLGPDTVSLKLEHALRRRNRVVVTYSDGNELVALISLTAVPSGAARAERAQLIGDATEGISGQNRVVAVGPLAGGVGEAGYSLAEARLTFDLAELSPSHGTERGAQPVVQPSISQAAGVVLDADSAAVERLAYRQMQPDVRRRFVDAFLSDLLHHDSVRGTRLLDTLNCWLDLGCNTAEAARKLHLERQSMHNRLQRIFELIGGDPRGGGRMAGIHLATKMARRFPAAVPSD